MFPVGPRGTDKSTCARQTLHEIRTYMHYANVKGTLGYWATPSGTEVDFVYSHGTRVMPVAAFLRCLHAGHVLGSSTAQPLT